MPSRATPARARPVPARDPRRGERQSRSPRGGERTGAGGRGGAETERVRTGASRSDRELGEGLAGGRVTMTDQATGVVEVGGLDVVAVDGGQDDELGARGVAREVGLEAG